MANNHVSCRILNNEHCFQFHTNNVNKNVNIDILPGSHHRWMECKCIHQLSCQKNERV